MYDWILAIGALRKRRPNLDCCLKTIGKCFLKNVVWVVAIFAVSGSQTPRNFPFGWAIFSDIILTMVK